MTEKDTAEQPSGFTRLRRKARRAAAATATRMAPRDADTGREPLDWKRKAALTGGSVLALLLWGAFFLWIVR